MLGSAKLRTKSKVRITSTETLALTSEGAEEASSAVEIERGEYSESFSSCLRIDHLPYGFFESELLKYFTQFGKVIRVRVARSKKTGNHKGWGFVQFATAEVAQIAAETMNGYLMFDKILICKVLRNNELPDCIRRGKTLLQRPSKYAAARRHTKIANAKKSKTKIQASKKRLRLRVKKKVQEVVTSGFDYSIQIYPSEKPNTTSKEDVELKLKAFESRRKELGLNEERESERRQELESVKVKKGTPQQELRVVKAKKSKIEQE